MLNTTAQTFSAQLTDNCCKSQKGRGMSKLAMNELSVKLGDFFVDVMVLGQPALWLGQTMSHKLIKHSYLLISLINVSFPGRPHSSISTIHCLCVMAPKRTNSDDTKVQAKQFSKELLSKDKLPEKFFLGCDLNSFKRLLRLEIKCVFKISTTTTKLSTTFFRNSKTVTLLE